MVITILFFSENKVCGLSKDEIPSKQHCPHPTGLSTDVSEADGPVVAQEELPMVPIKG